MANKQSSFQMWTWIFASNLTKRVHKQHITGSFLLFSNSKDTRRGWHTYPFLPRPFFIFSFLSCPFPLYLFPFWNFTKYKYKALSSWRIFCYKLIILKLFHLFYLTKRGHYSTWCYTLQLCWQPIDWPIYVASVMLV